MRITEREFQAQVIALARLKGWAVAHFRPARTVHGWRTPVSADGAGFPDLVLAKDGHVMFVELKSDTGTLSRAQEDWLEVLPNASVWRPRDWDAIVDILSGPQRRMEG